MPSSQWTDKDLRDDYRREFPECELARHIDPDDEGWRRVLAGYGRKPNAATVEWLLSSGVAVHHCWHCGQRWDAWTNLISLSAVAHDWCHAFPREGRLVCTWVKARKRLDTGNRDEFNRRKLREIAGYDVVERVLSYDPPAAWLADLQLDLQEMF